MMSITFLFAIVRKWKQPRCPLNDEWIKSVTYRHCGIQYLGWCSSYIVFIMLRCILSSSIFSKTFIIQACWIFGKDFSAYIEMIMRCLSLSPFMWFILSINLYTLKHPFILVIKPAWSWWIIFCMYIFMLFARKWDAELLLHCYQIEIRIRIWIMVSHSMM